MSVHQCSRINSAEGPTTSPPNHPKSCPQTLRATGSTPHLWPTRGPCSRTLSLFVAGRSVSASLTCSHDPTESASAQKSSVADPGCLLLHTRPLQNSEAQKKHCIRPHNSADCLGSSSFPWGVRWLRTSAGPAGTW